MLVIICSAKLSVAPASPVPANIVSSFGVFVVENERKEEEFCEAS